MQPRLHHQTREATVEPRLHMKKAVERIAPDSNTRERRAARPVGVVDCGNLAVGVEREKSRGVAFVRQGPSVRLVGEARFLKPDADLHPVGRRGGKELQPIGVLRRPACEIG